MQLLLIHLELKYATYCEAKISFLAYTMYLITKDTV
jgi:hypothetical protein